MKVRGSPFPEKVIFPSTKEGVSGFSASFWVAMDSAGMLPFFSGCERWVVAKRVDAGG